MQGIGVGALGAAVWATLLRQQSKASPFALRPPGALAEEQFLSACVKCGQCVVDCPYDTLKLATLDDDVPIGTPYFEPRTTPCYLCPDIPCAKACPTGALDGTLQDIAASRMGLAVLIDQENCLSYRGLRCEICHRECPLIDRAITLQHRPRGTSKHGMLLPTVHSDQCTGCGICERACPLPVAAIKVLPHELAQAAPGDHYGFGWEEQKPPQGQQPSQKDADAALEYLNEGGTP